MGLKAEHFMIPKFFYRIQETGLRSFSTLSVQSRLVCNRGIVSNAVVVIIRQNSLFLGVGGHI